MTPRLALRFIAIITFASLGALSNLPVARDLGIDPVFAGPWWRTAIEGLFVAILFGSAMWGNRGAWLIVIALASLAAIWSLGQAFEAPREVIGWVIAASYAVLALTLWGLKPAQPVGSGTRGPFASDDEDHPILERR